MIFERGKYPPKNDLRGFMMEQLESIHSDTWNNIVTDTGQYIWSPFSGGPKKGILTPKIWIFKGLSPP